MVMSTHLSMLSTLSTKSSGHANIKQPILRDWRATLAPQTRNSSLEPLPDILNQSKVKPFTNLQLDPLALTCMMSAQPDLPWADINM